MPLATPGDRVFIPSARDRTAALGEGEVVTLAETRIGAVAETAIAAAADHCLSQVLTGDWRHEDALAAMTAAGLVAVPDLVAVTTRVARILGERWVADTASFADVTLGLHRLTLLLFAIEALPDPDRERLHGGSVLLAPTPGDQHGFGLATVALALRRAGWDVTLAVAGDADALVAAARCGYDCIGLSVGHDRAVPRAARLIAAIRAATRRRPPTIAVGGPMLARDPGLAATVGADLAAADGFALAEQLRPLLAARAA